MKKKIFFFELINPNQMHYDTTPQISSPPTIPLTQKNHPGGGPWEVAFRNNITRNMLIFLYFIILPFLLICKLFCATSYNIIQLIFCFVSGINEYKRLLEIIFSNVSFKNWTNLSDIHVDIMTNLNHYHMKK